MNRRDKNADDVLRKALSGIVATSAVSKMLRITSHIYRRPTVLLKHAPNVLGLSSRGIPPSISA